MTHDYSSTNVREAADGVTEWDLQHVVYLQRRDGDLGVWQAGHLASGWTTQHPLEPTSDPADLATWAIGRRYEMFRPRHVPLCRANQSGADTPAVRPGRMPPEVLSHKYPV